MTCPELKPLNTLFLSCAASLLFLIVFFGVFSVNGPTGANLVHVSNHIDSFIPRQVLLILTVILATIIVVFGGDNLKSHFWESELVKFVCFIGTMSYSIFLWHQPIIAFFRYSMPPSISFYIWMLVSFFVILLSIFSYYMVEKRFRICKPSRILLLMSFAVINVCSFAVYARGGVVRDVPELNYKKGLPKADDLIEYNDKINTMNVDFPVDSGKINVLVIGNSFARDFCNVLLESKMRDRVFISYINDNNMNENVVTQRLKKSDYVFYFGWKHNVPAYFGENLSPDTEIWGIGTKNYGKNNGFLYKNRNHPDYYSQKIKIDSQYFEWNDQLKSEWGDNYIDFIKMSLDGDGAIVVFTDDNHFISPDCRHLSKSGAEYYARMIDWDFVFKKITNPIEM